MAWAKELRERAALLRVDSIRMTTRAGSGHPTSCMSCAEVVAALYFRVMKFAPNDWGRKGSDRLILSKGHAAPVMYAAWKQLGLISDDEMMRLRQFGSALEGHPTRKLIMGEAATGSLGQGLAVGAGMALTKISGHGTGPKGTVFVVMGDGEMAEGSVWEAARFAGTYDLRNLVAVVDCNGLGQTGDPAGSAEEFLKRFEAFGWHGTIVDGHDVAAVVGALETVSGEVPSVVIARTVKGKGYTAIEGMNGLHGKALSESAAKKAIEEIKARTPFDEQKLVAQPIKVGERTKKQIGVKLTGAGLQQHLKEMATREAFGLALADLGSVCQDVRVLDGDVSNSTYTSLFEQKFPERFTQCSIAEQTMIGVACGMEAKGAVPFAATFGAFITRAHDQLRMAGVGGHALRLAGSHAGVSIGQDGPSQMGLEDLGMMRAIPGSVVLYPCDAVSAYRLVEAQAHYTEGISYLRLTRIATPVIYKRDELFEIGGLKVLRRSSNDRLVLVAAGITVHEALKAHALLAQKGIDVTVVDLYSVKPLDAKKLIELASKAGNTVLTVEDHYAAGGLGEAVAAALAGAGIRVYTKAVAALPGSGRPEELMEAAGIDAVSIVQSVVDTVAVRDIP